MATGTTPCLGWEGIKLQGCGDRQIAGIPEIHRDSYVYNIIIYIYIISYNIIYYINIFYINED
jgi:hypothetical protein